MARFDYDLFTIGAGSGGVRASRLAGSKGVRVAVAEVSEEKARAFWEKLAELAVSRKKIHQLAGEEGDCLRLYWSTNTLQHDGGLLFRNTTF